MDVKLLMRGEGVYFNVNVNKQKIRVKEKKVGPTQVNGRESF